MLTRRNVLAGLIPLVGGGCAWLTGTRRRGRRRGKRRERRDGTPPSSEILLDGLEVGDVLVLDDGEYDVLSINADKTQALIENHQGIRGWVAILIAPR